jgi:hypothetical protein
VISIGVAAVLTLTGCGSATETEPADLSGVWKQSNSASQDAYQEAKISGNTIEIHWVSDGGTTTSLYWSGTYETPAEPGSHTWSSVRDDEETDGALLASQDSTKSFAYEDDAISYEVSALGTTTIVELQRREE